MSAIQEILFKFEIPFAHSFNEKVLQNDPSFYPAIAALSSLCVLWQLTTPKNMYVCQFA